MPTHVRKISPLTESVKSSGLTERQGGSTRQKAGTRGGKAPALACWPAVRRPAPANGNTWAREGRGAVMGHGAALNGDIQNGKMVG